MDVARLIEYWLTTAQDSRRVMDHLVEKQDYPEALFFGHLYLEKLLKALVVQRTGQHASPTHQLVNLATAAGLDLDATRQGQLDEVTGFNVATRYPDYRFAFKKACTKEFCAAKTALIDELAQWLKSAMKP